MRVGILGSGLMGGKLGTLFARAGHEVVFSYARGEKKLERLARDEQGRARAGKPRRTRTPSCSLPMNADNSALVVAHTSSGAVRIDPLFQATAPARAVGASVTFVPGARTAWHTHPLGQALIVTAGCGLAQCWGGPIEQIRPGDVIWFSPGEKQWHGATATTAVTHIAIQEQLDGKTADWMEKVSDDQYHAEHLEP